MLEAGGTAGTTWDCLDSWKPQNFQQLSTNPSTMVIDIILAFVRGYGAKSTGWVVF